MLTSVNIRVVVGSVGENKIISFPAVIIIFEKSEFKLQVTAHHYMKMSFTELYLYSCLGSLRISLSLNFYLSKITLCHSCYIFYWVIHLNALTLLQRNTFLHRNSLKKVAAFCIYYGYFKYWKNREKQLQGAYKRLNIFRTKILLLYSVQKDKAFFCFWISVKLFLFFIFYIGFILYFDLYC